MDDSKPGVSKSLSSFIGRRVCSKIALTFFELIIVGITLSLFKIEEEGIVQVAIPFL